MNDTQPNVVVVDLETGSMTPDAVIFTIGAVRFKPDAPYAPTVVHLRETGLYMYVKVPKQLIMGRVTDHDTVDIWWPNQSSAAQAEKDKAYSDEAVELNVALQVLSDYIKPDDRVYARGQEFERDILTSAYKMVGGRFFRRYNKIFDVRSWIEAYTGKNSGIYELLDHVGLVAHVSIDDCIRDALEMYFSRKEFMNATVTDPDNVRLVLESLGEVMDELEEKELSNGGK